MTNLNPILNYIENLPTFSGAELLRLNQFILEQFPSLPDTPEGEAIAGAILDLE
jgi:hypothetical protein